jgi:uncharacterized protein YgiB involved in biofilm formation
MPLAGGAGRLAEAQQDPLASRSGDQGAQGMWMPEMARAMMSRWISEVPSKMV